MRILMRSPLLSAGAAVSVMLVSLTLGIVIHYAEIRVTMLSLLRAEVRDLAVSAALLVDGDRMEEVIRDGRKDSDAYRAAVRPLVRFHNALPNVFYVYTMTARDGKAYFVLDTAGQPELRAQHLLKPSGVMEPYDSSVKDGWLGELAAGRVYTTPGFETDDYGTFMSGHAPIYNSADRIVGFSGIDVDADYYLQWQRHFRLVYLIAYVLAFAMTFVIGYLVFVVLRGLRRKADNMEMVSLRDPLTGIYNRRAFELRVESDFKMYRRSGIAFVMVMMDIDKFKTVNDTYGHDSGDAVLQALARTTDHTLREADFFARWGGEEFFIILNETAPDVGAVTADRLRQRIAETPVELPGGEIVHFTVSMGVSPFRDGDKEPGAALKRADEALYEAKQTGRNKVVLK